MFRPFDYIRSNLYPALAPMLLFLLLGTRPQKSKSPSLEEGDLIFQSSDSEQAQAIRTATGSRYSHVGILFRKNGELHVYEAIGPVRSTKLSDWVHRGKDEHYVVKRLKKADSLLDREALKEMRSVGKVFSGKKYDPYFNWSDERIYCSELVWKIYDRALDLRIGELQELSEFDLDEPLVRRLLKERYGDSIPLEEKVISPASMLRSDKLITVIKKAG